MPSAKSSGAPWMVMLRLIPRLVTHLLGVTKARLTGKPLKEILRFLTWLDTAAVFGVEEVLEPNGRRSALNVMMRRPARLAPPRPVGRVGALVITQDRSSRLASALQQLSELDFVTEVVVVDGGSADDSVDVARQAGATVFERKFDKDFAAQRNHGLNQMKGCDWVVRLDDDETFGPGLAGSIHAAMMRAGRCDAILVSQALFIEGERDSRTNVEAMAFKSRLRYRGRLPEFPTWSRPLSLPMAAPLLENRKSFEEMLKSNLVYGSVRPEDYREGWLDEAEKTLDKMRKESGL